MISIRRSWVHGMAAIIAITLTGAPSDRAAAQPTAQSTNGVSYVTVAIAKNPNERGHIKSFHNGPSVILLDGANLAPEALATLLNAYVSARRNGAGSSGKDVTMRVSQPSTRQLTLTQRKHYQAILDKLQLSSERVVQGVGKVQAIDVPVIGVP